MGSFVAEAAFGTLGVQADGIACSDHAMANDQDDNAAGAVIALRGAACPEPRALRRSQPPAGFGAVPTRPGGTW